MVVDRIDGAWEQSGRGLNDVGKKGEVGGGGIGAGGQGARFQKGLEGIRFERLGRRS